MKKTITVRINPILMADAAAYDYVVQVTDSWYRQDPQRAGMLSLPALFMP